MPYLIRSSLSSNVAEGSIVAELLLTINSLFMDLSCGTANKYENKWAQWTVYLCSLRGITVSIAKIKFGS